MQAFRLAATITQKYPEAIAQKPQSRLKVIVAMRLPLASANHAEPSINEASGSDYANVAILDANKLAQHVHQSPCQALNHKHRGTVTVFD
jgi:hypothetical protein